MKFNEQATVENYVIKFLRETLGYEYVKPEDLAELRSYENEYVIDQYLLEAVKQINDIDDELARSVLREVKKVDTNHGFLDVLREGVNIKNSETGQFRTFSVLDTHEPSSNHFVVTNQFRFQDEDEAIRTDVLVFVNGLPVVNIEAKSPTASESVSYEDAIGQIKRYEKKAGKLYIPNCFNIATDGFETVYGATYAPAQYFFSWRDEELAKKYTENEDDNVKLEVTLDALLTKEKLVDIIENFIAFEETPDGRVKKVARYQQVRAANKVVGRVKSGEHKQGLIWHTQGSGKTLTMFFAAWKLRFAPELANPKVFILVDRLDLDDQMVDEFMNHGGKNIIRVASREDLADKIASPERGIFISTTQKFAELKNTTRNLDENVVVLSDEAHRGEEGKIGINTRYALGNAFFFGFTGTPIDKTQRNTHRNFGPEGERYLDYYSIKQAIDDGATVPVTYEARLSKFSVDEEQIDEQFGELTADLDGETKQGLMRRYGKKEAIVKLPRRMEAVAQDIVEHYKTYIEPNGFKAQVVAMDREATAAYKKIFDTLLPKEATAVVYSPGDPNTDSDELQAYVKSKQERDTLIRQFKDPDHPLKMLLVCDMLLTGFDAPIEQVMYLDKPLRDHNLLQAIARTNRVYKQKNYGLVIDYYGITKNLEKALNFDESEIEGAMVNVETLKSRFVEVLHEVLAIFGDVNIEDPSIDNLRKCLKIFYDNEEKQRYFAQKYKQLKSLYEFLSPDPFLKDYLREFEWLTSFYIAFQKEFQSTQDAHLLSEYGEKMQELIRDSVDFSAISHNFRSMNIDEIYTLERQQDETEDDEEKAVQLEKMLKQEIADNVEANPKFESFGERLRRIKEEFEQSQIDLTERIKKYRELMEDIQEAHKEAKDHGFDLRQYGLYTVAQEFVSASEEDLHKFILDLSHRLEDLLDEEWQETTKRDYFIKQVKKMVLDMTRKEYVDRVAVDDFATFQNRIVDIVIKRF